MDDTHRKAIRRFRRRGSPESIPLLPEPITHVALKAAKSDKAARLQKG
jgi:hypothetical protein